MIPKARRIGSSVVALVTVSLVSACGGADDQMALSTTTNPPAEAAATPTLRDPLMEEVWRAIDAQLENVAYEDLVALGAVEGLAPTDRASKGRQLRESVAVYFSGPNEVTIAGPAEEAARIIRDRATELSRFTVRVAPPLSGGRAA